MAPADDPFKAEVLRLLHETAELASAASDDVRRLNDAVARLGRVVEPEDEDKRLTLRLQRLEDRARELHTAGRRATGWWLDVLKGAVGAVLGAGIALAVARMVAGG